MTDENEKGFGASLGVETLMEVRRIRDAIEAMSGVVMGGMTEDGDIMEREGAFLGEHISGLDHRALTLFMGGDIASDLMAGLEGGSIHRAGGGRVIVDESSLVSFVMASARFWMVTGVYLAKFGLPPEPASPPSERREE